MVSQQSYVSIAPGQPINVYPYGGTTTTPVASSVNPNTSGPNPNVPPPVAVNSSGGPSTMVSGTPTAAGNYSYSLSQHQVRQTIVYSKFLYHDNLFWFQSIGPPPPSAGPNTGFVPVTSFPPQPLPPPPQDQIVTMMMAAPPPVQGVQQPYMHPQQPSQHKQDQQVKLWYLDEVYTLNFYQVALLIFK